MRLPARGGRQCGCVRPGGQNAGRYRAPRGSRGPCPARPEKRPWSPCRWCPAPAPSQKAGGSGAALSGRGAYASAPGPCEKDPNRPDAALRRRRKKTASWRTAYPKAGRLSAPVQGVVAELIPAGCGPQGRASSAMREAGRKGPCGREQRCTHGKLSASCAAFFSQCTAPCWGEEGLNGPDPGPGP